MEFVPEARLSFPCQKSDNCTVAGDGAKSLRFPASARRTAYALQLNALAMCESEGIERIGFLTLTFPRHVVDAREAQRRFHSLTTHILKPRYRSVIRVFERHASGRIHYHLLVAIHADIRTGCDFEAFERRDYGSAPPALQAEWEFWRQTARMYGFGRTELLPVKTGEAVSRYMCKYILQHLAVRRPEDRGVRLVSYVGPRVASTKFGWADGKAREWRRKAVAFAQKLYNSGAISGLTEDALARRFGPRWAHYWRDSIASISVEEEPGAGSRVTGR